MMPVTGLAACVTNLIIVLVTTVLLPWVGMRLLRESLSASESAVSNYRGAEVPLGLGLVWVFWGAGIALLQAAAASGFAQVCLGTMWFDAFSAGPLVAGAFMFGLIDDTFGTRGHKGFRGHLSALGRGQLTTGALKLFGIGLLAAVGAAGALSRAAGHTANPLAHYLAAVALIALSANTVNLFDLRPLRALKVYLLFCVLAVFVGIAGVVLRGGWLAEVVPDGVAVLLIAIGPVVAVWRADASERAMLGDAGANGFGMLAGLLLAYALPFVGVVAAAVGLLALNLASERVSFSAVIERTPWLAKLDGWGRVPH